MNSESGSLPLAPETGCCSETTTSPAAPSGSVQPESLATESCCQSSATLPAPEVVASKEPEAPTSVDGAVSSEAASDGAAPDDAALIDALREVIDPELMINIVDLGLVYSINQTDRKVLVEMTLTSPACPAGPQIISQAKMSLEKLGGVDVAEIKLTMSPPWTPDRMTDDARDQLGIF